MDSLFSNLGEHVSIWASGVFTLGALAHAVNTFPTPKNAYGAWLLGVIQWLVGQRVVAANTLKGMQTIATGVIKSPD